MSKAISDSSMWLILRAAVRNSGGDAKEVNKTAHSYSVVLSYDQELGPVLYSVSTWQLTSVGFSPPLRFKAKELLERCQESLNFRL